MSIKKILTLGILIVLGIMLSSCSNSNDTKKDLGEVKKGFTSSEVKSIGGESNSDGSVIVGTSYDKENTASKENVKPILKDFSNVDNGINFNK